MSLRLSDDVERIVVIRRDAAGRRRSREVYVSDEEDVLDDIGMKFVAIEPSGRAYRGVLTEDLGPRKKQSKWLRPLERRVRKYARKRARTMSKYLALHDHSNREKRNGWIRDIGRNLRKAMRKSK